MNRSPGTKASSPHSPERLRKILQQVSESNRRKGALQLPETEKSLYDARGHHTPASRGALGAGREAPLRQLSMPPSQPPRHQAKGLLLALPGLLHFLRVSWAWALLPNGPASPRGLKRTSADMGALVRPHLPPVARVTWPHLDSASGEGQGHAGQVPECGLYPSPTVTQPQAGVTWAESR